MRWTMVVLAAGLILAAGCAPNRNVRHGEESTMAPSRQAAENDEDIKAGVDAAMRDDPNAGWSVPPGQASPDRPDGEMEAGQAGPAGKAPSNTGAVGGIFPASGFGADRIRDGQQDMDPRQGAMRGAGRNTRGGPSSVYRPASGSGVDTARNGSGSAGAIRNTGKGAGTNSVGMSPAIVGVPTGSDSPAHQARRRQPIVKPLVPAFPARMRQERLSALQEVRFAFDSDEVGEVARKMLEKNADWMKANPDVVTRVEGHADERGTPEYNLALGERRARKVRDLLIEFGVNPSNLMTVSYGEEMPIETASTDEAWSINRRTEFSRAENRAVSVNTSRPGAGS